MGLYDVGGVYIAVFLSLWVFPPGFNFAAAGSTMGSQLLPLMTLFQLFHIHQKDVLS